MEIRDLLADIHALEEELVAFERKYGIRTVPTVYRVQLRTGEATWRQLDSLA